MGYRRSLWTTWLALAVVWAAAPPSLASFCEDALRLQTGVGSSVAEFSFRWNREEIERYFSQSNSSFTQEDIALLHEYQSAFCGEVNKPIYSGVPVNSLPSVIQTKAVELDKLLRKGPELPVGLVLNRSTRLYAGERLLEPGEMSRFAGYASTSFHRQGPMNYGSHQIFSEGSDPSSEIPKVIEYEIVIGSSGIHGQFLGNIDRFNANGNFSFDGENEILLPRGVTFKVLEYKKWPGKYRNGGPAYEYYYYRVEATGISQR